jgi:hypothetical protein
MQRKKEKLTGIKASIHALITSVVSLSGAIEGCILHCCNANASVVAADKTLMVDGCAF